MKARSESTDVPLGETVGSARCPGQHNLSGAPVIDAWEVGVLTEEDLMPYYEYPEEFRAGTRLKDARVQGASLVTRALVTISPETEAEEIATLFIGRKIKRVPVMSEGRILGIVSRGDL